MNQKQIAKGYHKLGIRAGDTVLMHSSLSSFGYVSGGAKTVIRALLDVLTERGTLIVPTFSKYLQSGETLWDREKTPSLMGVISETVRTMESAVRSSHAAHPLCGIGPNAQKWLSKPYRTGFGEDSPFQTMVDENASVLLCGVGYNRCTLFHLLEAKADVPYRFLEERKAVTIIDGIKDPNGSAFEYTMKKGWRNDFETFGELLEQNGLVTRQAIGNSVQRLFKAGPVIELGMQKMHSDPYYLIQKPHPLE